MIITKIIQMDTGWIKIHRELLEKSIWSCSTPEQKTILITLLMMVNYEDREWEWKGKRYVCRAGQVVTSLDSICENAGICISVQNVRTALARFEEYGFLTNESTNRNRLITICNWDKYQSIELETNKQLTDSQQAANKQLTSSQQAANKQLTSSQQLLKNNKKDKNNKKEEEEYIYSLYPSKCPIQNRSLGKSSKDKEKISKLLKDYSVEELERKIRYYLDDCKKSGQYLKNFSTLLNNLPDVANTPDSKSSEIDPERPAVWRIIYDGTIREAPYRQYLIEQKREGEHNVEFIKFDD